jgi:hypothetical protein
MPGLLAVENLPRHGLTGWRIATRLADCFENKIEQGRREGPEKEPMSMYHPCSTSPSLRGQKTEKTSAIGWGPRICNQEKSRAFDPAFSLMPIKGIVHNALS